MSISLIESIEEASPGDLSALEKSLSEAVQESATQVDPAPQQNQPAPTVLDGDGVPAKLKGKTVTEVAEMYQNLESTLGRMANDLGTQRKLTDKLLDLKRTDDLSRNNPEPPKVDRAKLLEDPTAELERFISARDAGRVSTESQRLQALETNLAQSAFVQKHPDYAQIGEDPEFATWVRGSSFRQRAAQAAHGGDWTAADELMTEFKQAKAAAPKPEQKPDPAAANAAALQAARGAALETTNDGGGSSGKSGRIFKRVDLIALRMSKPDAYYDDAFQNEILKAYNEGRVK